MPIKLCNISESKCSCWGGKEGREGERKEGVIFFLPGGIKSLGAGMIGRELLFGAAETREYLGNLNI